MGAEGVGWGFCKLHDVGRCGNVAPRFLMDVNQAGLCDFDAILMG